MILTLFSQDSPLFSKDNRKITQVCTKFTQTCAKSFAQIVRVQFSHRDDRTRAIAEQMKKEKGENRNMSAYCYNGQQVINIGDEVPVKIAKVEEKAMTAQEAIEVLKSKLHDPVPKAAVTARNENEAINMAISALEKQLPAADVRPVVRGKWRYDGFNYFKCSLCGEPVTLGAYNEKDASACFKFCPGCGADMRTQKEEDP